MSKALYIVKLEIKGRSYARIFQFDNAKAAREFYAGSRFIKGVVSAGFGEWPTVLYSKAGKALEELEASLRD